MPYSVVIGDYAGNISYNNRTGYIFSDDRNSSIVINGLKTDSQAIPSIGSATYTGKAFNGTYLRTYDWDSHESKESIKEGLLSYIIDFSKRTGSGEITGLGDTIKLHSGIIQDSNISASAEQGYKTGNYSLGFFGKNAEEVAGKVIFNGKDTVGFGGQRGDIQK